nr:NADH dehydrogenase subunit 4 [Peloridium hammoniorum]
MLKYLFYILFIFVFLLIDSWWIMIYFFMFLLILFFMKVHYFNFYSSLSYDYGVDFLSMNLFCLSLWICILMLLSSMSIYFLNKNTNMYLHVILFLLLFLFFTFFSYNLFVLYISFEASLVPTLVLIFGWGYQPERLSAILYLLFYTLLASLPLLMFIFYLYLIHKSTFIFFVYKIQLNLFMYLAMTSAFLVKMPLFGFHLWLLSAHVEAPVSGSMILAGILLKLGGYGLMRLFYMVNFTKMWFNFSFFVISLIGSIMIGFFCLIQVDLKLLIAYSSICHMGYVIMGLMTCNQWGYLGALVLMIGHGLCSSGLFCLANMLYERLLSRSFLLVRGIINISPSLTFFWFLFCSSNMSSPPSLNLVGEIFLSFSIIAWSSLSIVFLMGLCFLGGAYSLFLFSFSQHGLLYSGMKCFKPISNREFIILILHWIPLNSLILLMDQFFC